MRYESTNVRTTLRWVILAVFVALSTSGPGSVFGDQVATEANPQQVGNSPAAGGCGCGRQGRQGEGAGSCRGKGTAPLAEGPRRGSGRGPGMGMGGSHRPGGGPPAEMGAIRALVHDYRQDLVREIVDVDGGVATTTRSPGNPQAVRVLRQHVDEMKALLESGRRIRGWDPLFSEIFDHYAEIEMVIEPLEDGVRVVETSANPEVVKLIRAHARRVSDFMARGPQAVHEPSALPDDYRVDSAAGTTEVGEEQQ